jgi:anion-transporting  ArsA/GET3 family ATPase
MSGGPSRPAAHEASEPGAGLGPLLERRSILVCCGPGGVGKTTTAAAVALEAARRGRRACVVTIDPARRLADALGLETLGNAPGRIEGPWSGELWAMMLDTKSTFDDLVRRYAGTEAQVEAILANRVYRNLSGALSGTQEYMAMEKLYELHEEGRFDLVVVDTPPTRNALDFLDAPRRLVRFLDNRIFRALMVPTRAYLRAVGMATRTFLRAVSRVVGAEVVNDAIAFFQAFEGMEEGFRERAGRVLELLEATTTGFVLVASPRAEAVEEARFFLAELERGGIEVEAFVVNRVHPRYAVADGSRDLAAATRGTPLEPFVANLAELRTVAEREEASLAPLLDRLSSTPVVRVPLFDEDVHDLDGLAAVAGHLFGGRPVAPGVE